MNNKNILPLVFSSLLTLTSFIAAANQPKVNGLDYVKITPQFNSDRIGKVNLNDSLLAHYSFDGSGNDKSGNNNHSLVNGTTGTKNRFGHEDNAFSFKNNFILTPDFSKILEDELTVTGWLYRNESSSGIEQVFEALTNVWEIFLADDGRGWAWKKASISPAFSSVAKPDTEYTMTASMRDGEALARKDWILAKFS